MEELVEAFKALADGNRIRILKLLEKRKMCVCELASVLRISQPAVSKHLKKLVQAGFIASERDGFWTNYFIRAKGRYTKDLSRMLSHWLKSEEVVRGDWKRAAQVDRVRLCCAR